MLLPLSPDTIRNFLPQGARLIITSKHWLSIILARSLVNIADSRGVAQFKGIGRQSRMAQDTLPLRAQRLLLRRQTSAVAVARKALIWLDCRIKVSAT